MKNKISRLSYFVKRLKDNGYVVWKMFDGYAVHDSRKWTILVNPGHHSLYITCKVNVDGLKSSPHFEFWSDYKLKPYATIATDSIEVIVNHLLSNNITPDSEHFKKDATQDQE